MKKITLLIVMTVLYSLFGYAQKPNSKWTKVTEPPKISYACGTVFYKDGHTEDYVQIQMPKMGTKELVVSNQIASDEFTTIPAEDISHITVWTKQFPEKKMTLHYLHADKPTFPGLSVHAWGFICAASPWGFAIECYPSYIVNSDGELGVVIEIIDGWYRRHVFLQCQDFTNAQHIGIFFNGNSTMDFYGWPNQYAAVFKSNPDIYTKVKKKVLRGKDLQYILDEMAIHQGLSTNEAKSVTEDEKAIQQTGSSETNGTVGDDE